MSRAPFTFRDGEPTGALPGRLIGEQWRFSRPALIAWLAGG